MDFELDPAALEAERRAAAFLEAESVAIGAFAGLPAAQARRLLVGAQRALALPSTASGSGSARPATAALLAVARASPALLLAAEATRHLRLLLLANGPGALPGEREALAAGERVGAVGLADRAGSGPARLTRDGDPGAGGGWRLSAEKPLVSNAPLADWVALFAEAEGGEAICLVAPGDPGIRVGAPASLLGLDGLAVASVTAEDARLPAARVLGPFPGRAASAGYLEEADRSAAVAAAGLMRSALRAASRHAHRHQRDGKPIAARQEVGFKLAEVLALTEAAELLCHRAGWMASSGDPEAATLARCAKVFCVESAERAASACLQIAGGEGYRRGSPAERAYRDAKGLALCGTTVERARMAIADALLAR